MNSTVEQINLEGLGHLVCTTLNICLLMEISSTSSACYMHHSFSILSSACYIHEWELEWWLKAECGSGSIGSGLTHVSERNCMAVRLINIG